MSGCTSRSRLEHPLHDTVYATSLQVMAAIVRQEDQEVTMSFTFELKGKVSVSGF